MASVWVHSYETKQGERHQVRWRDPVTKKTCYGEPQPYKARANELVKEKRLELANASSGMVLQLKTPKTIRDLYEEFFPVYKQINKFRSAEIMRYNLAPFLLEYGDRPINHFSTGTPNMARQARALIEALKNKLVMVRAKSGVNMIVRNIRTMFTYAVENGHLPSNPAARIKQFTPKKVARFLKREELCKLYLSVSTKKMRRAIYCMVYTGLRLGEFLNLTEDEIGYHEIEVRENADVAISEDDEGNKTGGRFVPMSPSVRRILTRVVGQCKREAFHSAFRKAVKRMNIGRIRPHDLRHTFASIYLQNGGTLRDLQIILGHKSLKMMEVYAHFQRAYLHERMGAVRFPKAYRKATVMLKVA